MRNVHNDYQLDIIIGDADKKPLIVGNKHWRGYNINEIYWFDLSKAKIVF